MYSRPNPTVTSEIVAAPPGLWQDGHSMSGRAVQRDNPVYAIETVSKVYADACAKRGEDWYEVDDWELPHASQAPYQIVEWIGTGKYSDVFTGYRNTDYSQLVAIKVLKPVRPEKYNREAKILLCLRGGPNIVELLDIVQNPRTHQYSLVFEHVDEADPYALFDDITPIDACFYLYQLMRALRYAHECGIMHRDVKPLNVIYDVRRKKLRLIDWGLAEFYHPKHRYNIHVASRDYKPIELLVDYQCYDYSIDIWSFGVTMAGIIFMKMPFFRGNDDMDMISKIAAVLGKEGLAAYLKKYGIPAEEFLSNVIGRKKPQPWASFVNDENRHLATILAVDLVTKCLRYDHMERITAEEALKHPYFDPVRGLPAN
jgi:casein kinase II subunit alpha